MKNKKIILLIFIVVFFLALIMGHMIYRNYKIEKAERERKAEIRYNEIRESVKKGVEWQISASYPGCTLKKVYKETSQGEHSFSENLINWGYIKKEDLLDIDGKSYCDVYVTIAVDFKDPYSQQHDCDTYYKIYLKCKDYMDKGFGNFDGGYD